MKQLTHFYHVYADGDWETPATEHFEELFMSGLIDELGDVFLGVVGSPENRRRVAMELPGVVVAEADEGWEQLTLTAVHDYAKQNDAYVYYAHTKGAWSKSDLATEWRVSMTHDTVTRWQECVSQLRSVDAVGPFWLQSQQPEHQKHDFFFAGNFWWATTDYLAKLPELAYDSRFSAEGWIGLGNPTVHVLREGLSYWGNFWKP
jgi:hypothetical protein